MQAPLSSVAIITQFEKISFARREVDLRLCIASHRRDEQGTPGDEHLFRMIAPIDWDAGAARSSS
jgi:hypothetical protein